MFEPETAATCSQCDSSTNAASSAPSTVEGFFSHLFDVSHYPARWQCGSWSDLEGWLHIVSDLAIFLAYFLIPVAIAYMAWRRRDFPFHTVFLLFAAFILCCGTSHLLEAVIFYVPIYRIAGLVKAVTAIVSWATLIVAVRYLPQVMALPKLADVNHRLREANSLKSQFLANMSHEIRTPMTAILGFTEVVLDAQDEHERREAALTIQRNSKHLLSLLNDILDLSKIESGHMQVESRSVNLGQLIHEIMDLQQSRADQKGLRLEANFRTALPKRFETDELRLKQILLNLVGNAIKFTDQGTVRIDLSMVDPGTETARLCISVTDTGIGIAPEHVSKLFQVFSQADSSTTRRYGGSGLGLVISRRLAEVLGGTLTVESEVGIGSCFEVMLPVPSDAPLGRLAPFSIQKSATDDTTPRNALSSPAPAISPLPGDLPVRSSRPEPATSPVRPEAPAPTPSRAQAARSLAGKRVLVVEDGIDNRRLLTYLLQKLGMEFETAEDGAQAVQFAQSKSFETIDIVLMDMQMPVMDGYAATERLRTMGIRTPIVALTAHAMRGDRDRCLQAGCNEYLSKPIDRRELVRKLEAILLGAAATPPSSS